MPPDTVTPRLRTARAKPRSATGRPRPPETASPSPVPRISAIRFARSLLQLSRPRIERQAADLEIRRSAAEDDVAWWEATMALNRSLRRQGVGHEAAMAAHLASQAVFAAANRSGLALGPDVTALARSEGEAARALVAGNLDATGAGYLTRDWQDFLIPPADPPLPRWTRRRERFHPVEAVEQEMQVDGAGGGCPRRHSPPDGVGADLEC
jgi:hypothetical protein